MRPSLELMCLLALCALLAGCSGRNSPTRYYLLQALVPVPLESVAAQGPVLGVGPITLRRYLNRNEIITGAGAGELKLADFDHWAEPLQDNVAQVLSEDLSRLLGARQVLMYPWPRSRSVDVQVEIDVAQFHAEADGSVVLQARWAWYRDDALLRAGRSDIRLPGGAADFASITLRQSQALAELSREIAAALPALSTATVPSK